MSLSNHKWQVTCYLSMDTIQMGHMETEPTSPSHPILTPTLCYPLPLVPYPPLYILCSPLPTSTPGSFSVPVSTFVEHWSLFCQKAKDSWSYILVSTIWMQKEFGQLAPHPRDTTCNTCACLHGVVDATNQYFCTFPKTSGNFTTELHDVMIYIETVYVYSQ